MFAAITTPLISVGLDSIVWWLFVGLIAGALATLIMRGDGYGVIGEILIGLIGALVGGFLASLIGLGASGLLGTVFIAFVGACAFIAILHILSDKFSRSRL
jgi:uncharacterized membrane protein YeaQ/YmgE (transglycosylase-associated protein family)